jgi:hypothetical protein
MDVSLCPWLEISQDQESGAPCSFHPNFYSSSDNCFIEEHHAVQPKSCRSEFSYVHTRLNSILFVMTWTSSNYASLSGSRQDARLQKFQLGKLNESKLVTAPTP